MITTPIAIDIPLRTDENGVIRVSNTRVTLHTILGFFNQGNFPEDLHDGFPTVPLADIYAVIAYYLANREVVDAYIKQVDEAAERIRKEVEAGYTPAQQARIEHLRKLAAQKRKEQDS